MTPTAGLSLAELELNLFVDRAMWLINTQSLLSTGFISQGV